MTLTKREIWPTRSEMFCCKCGKVVAVTKGCFSDSDMDMWVKKKCKCGGDYFGIERIVAGKRLGDR